MKTRSRFGAVLNRRRQKIRARHNKHRRFSTFIERLEARNLLATFAVNSTADGLDLVPGDGACDDGAGNCTLRGAIIEANALPGPDTVSVPAGTYTLTIPGSLENGALSGDLDITDDVTITGAGAASTVVDAAGLDRVFHIPNVFAPIPVAAVTFDGLTIKGGVASDAGGPGTSFFASSGGGILNEIFGNLITLSDSVVTDNTALGSAMLLSSDAQGGGIADAGGNWTTSNTQIVNNGAVAIVGAFGSGTGRGGGVYAEFTTTNLLIDTTISNNEAVGSPDDGIEGAGAGQGGGIYGNSGTWTMIGSTTIDSNQARGGPGVDAPGGSGEGGGIYSLGSFWNLTLSPGSTISRNAAIGGSGVSAGGSAAGGGIYSAFDSWFDPLTFNPLVNNTISGNRATGGDADLGLGAGGAAMGGGIFTTFGTILAEHLTIAENDATGGAAALAGTGDGGGIFNGDSFVQLKSSIVAANTTSSLNPDVSGAFTSADYNLIGDVGTATGFGLPGDQVGGGINPVINPLLGPLQNNGGPTETHLLLTGSPAIDAADPILFPATDQRGVARPQPVAGAPDIGAVEVVPQMAEPAIHIEKFTNGFDADTPTGPLIGVGNMAVFTYVVTNTGGVPLTDVAVSDDQLGAITNLISNGNGDAILDPMETWTYQDMTTVTPGQYMNTGSVIADDPLMMPVTDSDDSHHFGVLLDIDIEKSTNGQDADTAPGQTLFVGDTATFIYEVSNTGNVGLENIQVSDSVLGVVTNLISNGNGDAILDVGETWTYQATAPVTAGQYMNTGTVVGDDATDTVPGQVTDNDDSHYFGALVQIDIEKLTNGVDADSNVDPLMPQIAPGDTVTFDYLVSNTGNVPLDNVVVEDNNGTPLVPGDDFNPPPVLSGGFNVGDTNMDNILDLTEVWEYQFVTTAQDLNVVIDFDTDGLGSPLTAGTIIDNEYANLGLSIFGDEDPVTGMNRAMIFDSAATTVDLDLGTPNTDFGGIGIGAGGAAGAVGENRVPQGNILIVSDDLNPLTPDAANRGTVTFDWGLQAVRINSVHLLDVEDGMNSIDLFDSGGSLINSITSLPNTGNNGLQIVVINEPFVSKMEINFGLNPGTLDKIGIAQVDYDRTFANLATATGDFNPTAVATDPSHHRNPLEASIDVEKSTQGDDADLPPGPVLLTGTQADFEYVVTATGDVPLEPASFDRSQFVVDDNGTPGNPGDDFFASYIGGDLNNNGILDLNEEWTYQASLSPVTPGQYTNVGSVEAIDATAQVVTPATDSDTSNHFGADPSIDVEKLVSIDGGVTFVDADTATGPFLLDGFDAPRFKFVVTNTGNVDLANVTLDDSDFDLNGAAAGTAIDIGNLAVGADFEMIITTPWAAGQHINTATAEGDFTDDNGNNQAVNDTDDANYFGAVPQIAIEKLVSVNGGATFVTADSPTGPKLVASGPAPEFKFEVTIGSGAGAVDLDNVVVSDPSLGGTIAGPASGDDGDLILEAGETWVYLATGTWAAGQQTNTGSADGDFTDDGGATEAAITATDDANYFGAVAAIDIEKLVSVDGGATFDPADAPTGPTLVQSGPAPEFKFEVTLGTGLGSVPLSNIVVSDPSLGGTIAGPASGDDGDGVLETGETWIYLATGSWVIGQNTNTGTATGQFTDDGGVTEQASDQDDANYFGASPAIDIEKHTNGVDADTPTGPNLPVGGTATFSYFITNTGNVDFDIADVAVTDSVLGTITNIVDQGDGDSLLEVGETWELEDSSVVTAGQYMNTGSVTADYTDDGNTAEQTRDQDDSHHFGILPEVDLEKFTRIDVNPIDIQKLVRVEAPSVEGDVCDVLGKPVTITFQYLPGSTVDTDQDPSKSYILFHGAVDNDGVSFVVVSDESNPNKVLNGDGKIFFSGDVAVGDYFNANEEVDSFGSTTYIHFFDDASGGLLQSVTYHTSCSQPIQLGDVIGNATLAGYEGESGSAEVVDLGPGVNDDDADRPTGPEATPGDTVVFTYVVTNPISGTQISNIQVTDEVLAPVPEAPFAPDPVLDGGFNVGDTNVNNLLDSGEQWLYTSHTAITQATPPGQYIDKATVTGNGGELFDLDPAHFTVPAVPPVQGDVCDVLGKPEALTFEYDPGTTVTTAQDSNKAEILFDSGSMDDDGVSFVVVTDEDDPNKARTGDGKIFFSGNVAFNATFEANEDTDSFGSTTYIHFFDNSAGGLLQSITYHTSCSQPIQLGDVIGNATLVAYEGEDGSAAVPPPPTTPPPVDLGSGIIFATDDPFNPGNLGEDADSPTGPIAQIGDKVTYTYQLSNPGLVPLTIEELVDDNETPGDVSDDFTPTPVLVGGFNLGDANMNELLDPGEVWYFQVMQIATAPGQHKNTAEVTVADTTATATPFVTMFEAEAFDSLHSPWQVFNYRGASGGQFIGAPNGTGSYYSTPPLNRAVTYTFSVDNDSDYEISGLVYAPTGEDNSFWVQVDGGAWIEWHTTLNSQAKFEWKPVTEGAGMNEVNFNLAAGPHTLVFKVREDGTFLDKIMVSQIGAATLTVTDSDMSHHLVNPLAIEKYVFVPSSLGDGVDQCDDHGKPQELSFHYSGGGQNATDTAQPEDKFDVIDFVPGGPNEALTVFIRATDKSNAYDLGGDIYFVGTVDLDTEFTIAGDFGSSTYLHIFDAAGTTLLQTVRYHTSCSAPIVLGDVVGGVTVTGFLGDDGQQIDLNPDGPLGDPADTPTGPIVLEGDEVVFNFEVTNLGNVDLTNVEVTDSQLGPVTDFVDMGDGDSLLEPGETWILTSSYIASVPGQQMNVGTVTANSVQDPGGDPLSQSDPAYHFVECVKFFVPDKDDDATYRYTESGQAVGDMALHGDNNDARGATALADRSRLWVLDKDPYQNVYVYDGAGNPVGAWQARETLAQGGDKLPDKVEGIATDGIDHWIVENDKHRVYFYSGGAGFVSGSHHATSKFSLHSSNDHARGITTDGASIWVVDDDGSNNRVFKYTVGGTYLGSWAIDPANDHPRGITVDAAGGTSVWIVDQDADQVFQYDGATGLTSGSKTADFVFHLDPANDKAEGIAAAPCVPAGNLGIDIEKLTNGVDADSPALAPEIAPGATVTWTYEVANTGNVPYTLGDIEIVDDAGTPADPGDDFSIASGDIVLDAGSDVGNDGILSAGEVWTFEASGIAQDLSTSGATTTFYTTGSSSQDGPNGNVRTFTSDGISVNASAFSRDSHGVWEDAYLGAYSSGLGVTDNSEGDGTGGRHRVDNIGRLNYVLFAFSENVIVDRAFLDSVRDDSDLSVWIGTIPGAFTNPITLDDAVLSGLALNETNNTGSNDDRWADINAGEVAGNVLVLAASVEDTTPEDQFKISKLEVQEAGVGVYENIAVVTAGHVTDEDLSHYTNLVADPGIDIEKFTNGVNADSPSDAPQIAPGAAVTWMYEVANTGDVPFTLAEIEVVDDAGTPGDAGDDFSIASGDIVLDAGSDVGKDGILSAGEVWTFEASGIADDLSTSGATTTFYTTGSSSLDGPNGNIRTFNSGGISVNASAFSRDSHGVWEDAYLGAYSSGLGVTDNSEGDGRSGRHRVDNIGRLNYVLFAFSENVIVDRAFLDSVRDDSDLSVWIGTIPGAFSNPLQLSDAVLSGLARNEVNNTRSGYARWADINSGEVAGNVLVLAASIEDSTPDDRFKISKLEVQEAGVGIYKNIAVVTAGAAADEDPSHYTNAVSNTGIDIQKLADANEAPVTTVNRFIVNSVGDGADANLADNICETAVPGECTLRAAIQQANATANLVAGPDEIVFDINGSGPHTIHPKRGLPTITDTVAIDGTVELDFDPANGNPVIEINGSGAGKKANGLVISAGGAESVVRGLAVNRFKGHGIVLSGSEGNTIAGNYLGTDPTGTIALGNGKTGIFVSNSSGNLIGGMDTNDRNVIAGNQQQGIRISSGSSNNAVQGNLVGTDATGTTALGNRHGISVINAPSNLIGGMTADTRNVISGNVRYGVQITGTGSTNNRIEGNYIGTDVTGSADLGNWFQGVVIAAKATSNTIGGSADGAANVISGNDKNGVYLVGGSNNVLQGNLIGTDATGTFGLGNGRMGVAIVGGGTSHAIGGAVSGAGNVISANGLHGVMLGGNATSNLVQGNLIGTDVTGSRALGNNRGGIRMMATASSNTIGGTEVNAGNIIANNGAAGVALLGGTGNAIRQNSFFDNKGLGIDLNGDGIATPDASEVEAETNQWQNSPTIKSTTIIGGNVALEYTVPSVTADHPVSVEFFLADSSGSEGKTYLGSHSFHGLEPTIVVLPMGPAGVGAMIVATATDANGNTSEFSGPAPLFSALLAAGGGQSPESNLQSPSLTSAELAPIVQAATVRLAEQGVDATLLSNVEVSIADLPGATLGLGGANSIVIDVNAAGHGWFVDATPLDDSQFASGPGLSTLDSRLSIDLLTVVMHELGHAAGLHDLHDVDGHAEDDLMHAWLEPGVRKTSLEASLADEAFAAF